MGPPAEAPGAGVKAPAPNSLSLALLHVKTEEEHEDNLVFRDALKGFS